LIVLLEELPKHSPSGGIFFIFLDFGLKAKNSFLNFTLVNQSDSFGHKVIFIFVFILLLKLNFVGVNWGEPLHLGFLLPHFVPFSHHILVHPISPFLFPHIHHLIELLLGKLLFAISK
jgi:hypothetical protein